MIVFDWLEEFSVQRCNSTKTIIQVSYSSFDSQNFRTWILVTFGKNKNFFLIIKRRVVLVRKKKKFLLLISKDWCEPNYTHFSWMAETWNTITNITYIILAIQGFRTVYKDAPFKLRLLPTIFSIIGVGSFLFHATLLRTAQLLDELPMLYLISQSCFIVLTIQPYTSNLKKYLLAIFGIFINGLVTITMIYYPGILFFEEI